MLFFAFLISLLQPNRCIVSYYTSFLLSLCVWTDILNIYDCSMSFTSALCIFQHTFLYCIAISKVLLNVVNIFCLFQWFFFLLLLFVLKRSASHTSWHCVESWNKKDMLCTYVHFFLFASICLSLHFIVN